MQDTTVRSETGHDRDGSHTRPSNTTAHTILTVGNLQVINRTRQFTRASSCSRRSELRVIVQFLDLTSHNPSTALSAFVHSGPRKGVR